MTERAILLGLLLAVPLAAFAGDDALFEGETASHWIASLDNEDVEVRRQAAWALWNLGSSAGTDAAIPLAHAIEDEDEYVRSTSAKALPKLGQDARPAVEVLAALITSNREEVRRGASIALFQLGAFVGEQVAAIARGLDSEDPVVKANIAGCLAAAGPAAKPATKALVAALDEEDAQTVTWAARALASIDPLGAFRHTRREVRLAAMAPYMNGVRAGGEPVFLAIVRMLGDEDEDVRSVAANATGNAYLFAPKNAEFYDEAKATLIATLGAAAAEDDSEAMRECAVYAMGALGAHADGNAAGAVTPRLLAAAEDPAPAVRCASFQALRTLHTKVPAAVPVMLEAMGDPDTRVRTVATLCIASVAAPTHKVIGALTSALEDWDPRGRCYAARGLATFGADAAAATTALLACLHAHKDRATTTNVAEALAEIGPAARDALPALKAILVAEGEHAPDTVPYALCRIAETPPEEALNWLIRRAGTDAGGRAHWALGKLGPAARSAVPALIHMLEAGSAPQRANAAHTLGLIGSAATAALPALEQATNSEDESLAAVAAGAVQSIRGEQTPPTDSND